MRDSEIPPSAEHAFVINCRYLFLHGLVCLEPAAYLPISTSLQCLPMRLVGSSMQAHDSLGASQIAFCALSNETIFI